jgi:hypothetical protein
LAVARTRETVAPRGSLSEHETVTLPRRTAAGLQVILTPRSVAAGPAGPRGPWIPCGP